MTVTSLPHDGDMPADTEAAKWIYRMEVAHALPLINLNRTPIASMLSEENHAKFLGLMRRQYARFSSFYRISGAFMVAILLLRRDIGYWLTVPTVLMAIPSLGCNFVMNSRDVLKILPRQYEFWFFTVTNVISWGCLASFYSDFRILSLLGGIIGTESVILIDANFRTTTSSIRSTSVAAPVMLVLGIATFLRIIDTDERNYRVIPIAKVKVTLLDVFVNTSITLAIFIARKGYAKRKVLITQSTDVQTIRCVVFRSKLQLKKPSLKRGLSCTTLTETRTFVVQQAGPRESPRVMRTISSFSPATVSRQASTLEVKPFHEAEGAPAHALKTPEAQPVVASSTTEMPAPAVDHEQQVTLVSMRLGAIDVRHVVAPQLAPLHAPLSTFKAFLFHANAFVGFATTVFTLTRRPAGSEFPPTNLEYALAATALVTTLVFFLTCATSFHRELARSLLHNFDFLFSSVQFTLAILLICDMVRWDFRTFGALSWFLGFHSVLFLDALTPPIKRHLRFRKVFLLPVIVASLLAIAFIVYGFFFSNVAEYFADRTIWEMHFRGKMVGLRTKSLLLNRLFTVLLWSFRLVWEVAGCPDDELIFIRGNLDYLTPMEMFPPLKSSTSAVASKGADASKAVKTRRGWPSRHHAVYATNAAE